jgi:hypothetical protein
MFRYRAAGVTFTILDRSEFQSLILGALVLSLSILVSVVPNTSHVESGAKRLGVPASYIKPRHCADGYKGKNCVSIHADTSKRLRWTGIREPKTTARQWPAVPSYDSASEISVRSCMPLSVIRDLHSLP